MGEDFQINMLYNGFQIWELAHRLVGKLLKYYNAYDNSIIMLTIIEFNNLNML